MVREPSSLDLQRWGTPRHNKLLNLTRGRRQRASAQQAARAG
jgi:hypothetical protein